ncbi:unnamed protein product [Acanthoscelides obtectus]|uniref:Uncharacterized protein n=1 Tax=Acanthoscelides obtectus TaxID=200917 RepID=A0A9P0PAK8_ACAOB|nr:unnamed protein product [Acanthoscelides obtectus]CAK1665020.1 hypothetical protein AOBTE_LOCUS24615 [Acanthoscelides obtectus]
MHQEVIFCSDEVSRGLLAVLYFNCVKYSERKFYILPLCTYKVLIFYISVLIQTLFLLLAILVYYEDFLLFIYFSELRHTKEMFLRYMLYRNST